MNNKLQKLIENPQDLIDFILDLIGEDYGGSVGLRGLYKNEKLGELRPSMVWEDGEMTDTEMDGTSAIVVARYWSYESTAAIIDNIKKYAKHLRSYGDGEIGLVIGDEGMDGEDLGEIIIPNAKVIHIWSK